MHQTATELVRKLQLNGFEAYFAGGSVRDIILGKDPKDIDIATSASPDQIQELFPDNIPIGKQFGVILVKSGGHTFEIATFREEGPYLDKRRPSYVKFTSAEIDAKRRDFTINGIFYDPIKDKFIDFVGGQNDIKKQVVRFIGDASERIEEDNLRLIRAIRFKTTLNFQYADNMLDLLASKSALIKNVSPERIRDELNKIMQSSRRHIGLTELVQTKILSHIIPEIDELKGVPQPIEYHHEGDVFTHTYLAIKSLPADAPLHLVWAVLLHDIGKPPTLIREEGRIIFHDHAEVSAKMAREILRRLKFSRIEIDTISYLIDNHMKIAQIPMMRPTKQLSFLLDYRFPDLISLCEADSKGTYPVNLSLVRKLKEELEQAKAQKAKIEKTKSLTKLFTGDNLIKLGYTPSKQFKEILDDVNDQILSGKLQSSDQAMAYVQEKYSK